ncbi:MAG: 3-isopropylmalate dehydratase large subunit [Abditibacteriota bacterium]|nr:3-isopropylmalate dehydratase large subunit [Abditibacteriota bacterium]
MSMTITEKILAAHAGREQVEPGEIIKARLDLVMGNDITAPIAISEFEKLGAAGVYDRERVAIVPDHCTPNKDIKSAELVARCRRFARQHDLPYFFETGRAGIEHALIPDQGLVGPGDAVIGADSHTCTYGALGAFSTGVGSTDLGCAMAVGETWFKVPEQIKFVYYGVLPPYISGKDLILYTIGKIGVDGALYSSMEFTGEAIEALDMAGRFTMCNMAIEAGAKNGIVPPDGKTLEYIRGRLKRGYTLYESDPDAVYSKVVEIDVSGLEPQVSFPHLPENAKPVSEASGVAIQQAVIGSCTNGRIEDMRAAAAVLAGRHVHRDVRCIILPSTQQVVLQMIREGLMEAFIEAGCVVSTPTCGPCLGGHMGVLAKGEKAISTTNRNFVGRMGHTESEVYLASPAIAAASAVLGRIGSPEELK